MAHWVEGLFQFLFKYRPSEFASARFAFGAPFSVIMLILAAAAIGVPAVLSYAGVRGKSSRRDRWVLGALRVAALVVLMACLFRPMLLLSAAVPQRNYVGVLIDDSRSMRIADRDGKPRSDWVEHAFGGPDSAVLKALRQKFIVRLFRFSSNAERIDSVADLSFNAGETPRRRRRRAGTPGARRGTAVGTRGAHRRRRQLARADRRRAALAARAARFRSSRSASAPIDSTRTSRFGASRRRTRCSRAARSSPIS